MPACLLAADLQLTSAQLEQVEPSNKPTIMATLRLTAIQRTILLPAVDMFNFKAGLQMTEMQQVFLPG